MKNTKNFLIISSIIHLLILIVLTYVVLPPVDNFKDFLGGLSVTFVKLNPVVRRETPVKEEIEPVEQQEKEPEVPQGPKPPQLASFSLPSEDSVSVDARIESNKKTTSEGVKVKKRGMAAVQPPIAQKPILPSAHDKDVVVVQGLHQQDNGSLADASGKTDFPGLQSGPIGTKAGGRGLTEQYVNILYSTAPQKRKTDIEKFAKIMPELAQSTLEGAIKKKIDIVFIIDTTGSMRDNVRGVKDYIGYFLKPIEEKGFDAALGLVEFTDQEIRKAKVVGLTRSQKEFKKWLDKTKFFGGADIPESGYEAMIAALEEINFRDNAQKFFVFISDAPQHDFDYDGLSRYTLDRIIARLSDEEVKVHVIGANFRPMKLLAQGTGGLWKHIPGGDPVMDIPHPTSNMIRSRLERSLPPILVEDKVTVEFSEPVPDWVDLSYKMLDPRGFKCLGTLTYRKEIQYKAEKKVEFSPTIDLRKFDQPGIYTLIYRIRDSAGNWDVLRRTLELRRADS